MYSMHGERCLPFTPFLFIVCINHLSQFSVHYTLSFTLFSLELFTSVIMLTCSLVSAVCVYVSVAVVWVHLCVSVSGPSNALLIQSSAVICVTDLSLMGEQLRTILCHRGGVPLCVRV